MIERYADNNGIKIHYLDNGIENDRLPVVYVPGMLGRAEYFVSEFPLFAERQVIALSVRGCGKSDAPASGYALHNNASDVGAVIEDAGINRFILLAYSAGVAFSLAYAVEHPQRLAGVILLDYPAGYRKYRRAWVERVSDGVGADRLHVVKAISRESADVPLWHELAKLACPTTLIYGGKSQLINTYHLEQYRAALPQINLICFEGSGHRLWQPDYDRFIAAIREQIIHIEKE